MGHKFHLFSTQVLFNLFSEFPGFLKKTPLGSVLELLAPHDPGFYAGFKTSKWSKPLSQAVPYTVLEEERVTEDGKWS